MSGFEAYWYARGIAGAWHDGYWLRSGRYAGASGVHSILDQAEMGDGCSMRVYHRDAAWRLPDNHKWDRDDDRRDWDRDRRR